MTSKAASIADLAPGDMAGFKSLSVDSRVFGFAAALSIAVAIAFGLIPLLPALRARTIAEIGVQSVLRAADSAQLLGPAPDYSIDPFVMDAADTVVEIHAMGKVFTHVAYALDMPVPADTVESEARNLADAIAEAGLAEDELGRLINTETGEVVAEAAEEPAA